MSNINPQAEVLNTSIKTGRPFIYQYLSERGRRIFFPKSGILAQSADAKDKKINATIGAAVEADGTPMRLDSIADNILNIDPKDTFPYAPSFGQPAMRTKWKEMIYRKNPSLKSEISLPVVTNALTHGISMLGYLFINPGDSVILTDKFWGNYKLVLNVNYEGKLDSFETFDKNGFNITGFEAKIDAHQGQKKIIILNFPNNPTGYTPTTEEVRQIVKLLKNKAEQGEEFIIILDDAYFGLVYEEGVYPESIFSELADLHENILAVKVDGATKEDYAWGFRVGFITYGIKGGTPELYQALEAKTAGAVRSTISNAPNLAQGLLLQSFSSPNYESEKKAKYNLLRSRYEKVKEVVQASKYQEFFKPLPYNSGYFMCIELKENLNTEAIRQTLLNKYNTGVIAIGNLFRIAFSGVAIEHIPELFENIYQACKETR